ncbi:hypothetical protein [Homoserinibacter sp. YIM 151385]|uniref:hypothetical protein n=1 Tax=Homoserinibacter sp. YIM 151385 TaxID=2985506 RepID=UPI0022F07EC0|nr:hypothetical protein [Homoserinibacter sp. YIM 151385]WBU37313.1 hypothetical protein OF852_10350 [Homoserinibacter sp. YIM 151385]
MTASIPGPDASAPTGYLPPRPPRPALEARLARSSRVAGGLGFTLMSLGWALLAAAAGLLAFGAFFGFLFSMIARSGQDAEDVARLERMLAGIDVAAIAGLLVVAIVVGAGIWTLGLLASAGILKRSGHPRPWGVTWAATGIAVVASWVLQSILSVILQTVATIGQIGAVGTSDGGVESTVVAALAPWALTIVVGGLVSLALTVAVGVLSWWWMAHAMRPAAHPLPDPNGAPRV